MRALELYMTRSLNGNHGTDHAPQDFDQVHFRLSGDRYT